MLGGCGGQCAGVELLVTSLEKNVVGRRLDATTALKQQHAQREGGGEAWPLDDPHRRPILTGGGTHNDMKLRFVSHEPAFANTAPYRVFHSLSVTLSELSFFFLAKVVY